MHKIKLNLEKGDGTDIWGWVEDVGLFSPNAMSYSIEKIKEEIIEHVKDHILHDGATAFPWKKILDEGYEFEIVWYQGE